MKIYTESFNDYQPWDYAKDYFKTIKQKGKLKEFEKFIENLYPDGISFIELNDLLLFNYENIFKNLGIQE